MISFALSFSTVGKAQSFFTDLEENTTDTIWINANLKDTVSAFSGKNFAFTNPQYPYGLGFITKFPEAKVGHNCLFSVGGWVKSNNKNPHALYVISIEREGKSIFWHGIALSDIISDSGQWYQFADTLLIPQTYTYNSNIKAYLWNNSQQRLGIDDLGFSFGANQNPSYLPQNLTFPDLNISHAKTKNLFENDYYSILYDSGRESIRILDANGEILVNSLHYTTEKKVSGTSASQDLRFKFSSSKMKKGEQVLSFKFRDKSERCILRILCNSGSPNIRFEVENKFRKEQDTHRSALVFGMDAPLKEVFRSNRKSDTSQFQEEYWLNRQGAYFANNTSGLMVYHNPEISSMQLQTEQNKLVVNLDYANDHPYFRFPLAPDSSNWKLEQSFSAHQKCDRSQSSFSIWAGIPEINLPRLMKNPLGFEATYIWTEHADFSDIRTNRATYFGREDIRKSSDAIGGFLRFNIPVTKSVFYGNPDGITNEEASDGLFTGLESSIQTDTAFASFLRDIHSQGHEICLHTPEQFTTNRAYLEEALAYMSIHFQSPSWIDHGHNNGLQNNREDFLCDGTLEESQWYAMDLWEQYGVNYFQNPYYEEFFSFQHWQFNQSIEKPSNSYGDFIPRPDYFLHPSQTGDIYHWPNTSALFVKNESDWSFYFNDNNLSRFTENWGVDINHCYPAWTHPDKGFWKYTTDSLIVAQDGFNNTLALMDAYRNRGLLNVTTVADFMDYQLALEKIKYEFLADGRIRITNLSHTPIQGLSFATKGSFVLVDRLKPAQKKSGTDLIFWFDLEENASSIIRILE